MFDSLVMFLAPESAAIRATPGLPPAPAAPAQPLAPRIVTGLRLAFSVLGNTVGFAAMLGWCWLSLWLAQAFLAT